MYRISVCGRVILLITGAMEVNDQWFNVLYSPFYARADLYHPPQAVYIVCSLIHYNSPAADLFPRPGILTSLHPIHRLHPGVYGQYTTSRQ